MIKKKEASIAAKALSDLGASLGGKARAAALTPEQRSQMARNAVISRWAKEKGVPKELIAQDRTQQLIALDQGPLNIGSLILSCAVLNNQLRVISFRSFSNFLSTKGGGAHWKKKREGETVLPEFISGSFLSEFIDGDLIQLLSNPITYISKNGMEAEGIEATIIPRICDVWIKALNAGKLDSESRKETANRAYQLLNTLANVGIIALIDEATGYQKRKDSYQKILSQYIAPELRPWIKTFEDGYYKELYRLLGWDWDAFKKGKKNHPQYLGKLTNRLVYEKLAPGILEALNELNPRNEKGNRSHKHHQDLSGNLGYIKLIKHLSAVTTIMEQFNDGEIVAALHKIDSRYPSLKIDFQLEMDFPIPMSNNRQLSPGEQN